MKICLVEGCESRIHGKGLCNKHYKRMSIHGNPLTRLIRDSGAGTIMNHGYTMHQINGRSVLNHVLIAEKALGKRLPKGSEVHHVDGSRTNDNNSNLVICQDRTYHKLLHMRTDALRETGNANFRKCPYCHNYDDPAKMKREIVGKSDRFIHRQCVRKYRNRKLEVKNDNRI